MPDYVIFEFPICQAWMIQVCGPIANGEKVEAPLYEDAEIAAELEAELDELERRMKRRRKRGKKKRRR